MYIKVIPIDKKLRLITKRKEEWVHALPWYRDQEVLFYTDGLTGCVYDKAHIEMMYEYLTKVGELYFIEVCEENKWKTIGDVGISEKNMPITIGDKTYWRKGIGTQVLEVAIRRAEKLGFMATGVEIHHYNKASQRLYEKKGFIKVGEDKINNYYIYIFNTLEESKYPIRRADEEDIEFLYYVKGVTLRPYYEEIEKWNEETCKLNIIKSLNNHTNYIIYFEGEKVGVLELGLYKETVEIITLEILPEYQGLHIGRSILRDVIKYYKKQNRIIELRCLKNNERAQELFEKVGFKYVEDIPNYFIYTM